MLSIDRAAVAAAVAAALFIVCAVKPAKAVNVRSQAVKDAFANVQACPSTALNKLPCPGFVIDDKIALDCGGTDTVGNKQWLTIAAGKKKDTYERSYPGCKHPTKAKAPQ